MLRKEELRSQMFRKETFNAAFHYWLCTETGERFEDEDMADLNLKQVYDQYRAKYPITTLEKLQK